MALDPVIIEVLRDEIGPDTDWVDNDSELVAGSLGSLESLYLDPNRGGENVLRTALLAWRKRLAAMQARSFDVTKEGNWLARSQRVKFLQNRVEHYERLLRDKPKGKNSVLVSRAGTGNA